MNQFVYKDTLTLGSAQNLGWNVRKRYIIDSLDPKGTLSIRVPLKNTFGFCEDYDKVVYGLKHSLMLMKIMMRTQSFEPTPLILVKLR